MHMNTTLHLAAAFLTALIVAMAAAHPVRAATPQNATQDVKKESHAGHAAMAGTATVGPVTISEAYARASIGRAPNSGAYMMLTSTAEDRLVAAETPAAARAELHTHLMDNGVMKMRPVEGGIPVAPGAPTMLQPGGFHVMLMGLTGPMTEGETIDLTLTFEKAGKVTLQVPVRGIAARGHRHAD